VSRSTFSSLFKDNRLLILNIIFYIISQIFLSFQNSSLISFFPSYYSFIQYLLFFNIIFLFFNIILFRQHSITRISTRPIHSTITPPYTLLPTSLFNTVSVYHLLSEPARPRCFHKNVSPQQIILILS